VFENRVLRRMFGHKTEKSQEEGGYITRSSYEGVSKSFRTESITK
jgi:hypothetical protein